MLTCTVLGIAIASQFSAAAMFPWLVWQNFMLGDRRPTGRADDDARRGVRDTGGALPASRHEAAAGITEPELPKAA